jgi:hypothetical protein
MGPETIQAWNHHPGSPTTENNDGRPRHYNSQRRRIIILPEPSIPQSNTEFIVKEYFIIHPDKFFSRNFLITNVFSVD